MEICVSKQIGFSLMVGRNFTIFALFYFVFEGNFQVHQPPGSLYLEGRFNGGFFAVRVLRGLTFGVAYTWRDLFSKFYGIFGTTVMSSRTYITQVLCDNNLITRAFKSDYGCAKIAVQYCEVHVTTLPKEQQGGLLVKEKYVLFLNNFSHFANSSFCHFSISSIWHFVF